MPLQTPTSYVTVDDADAYFAGRLTTRAWDDASPEAKQKSLIQASTMMDSLNYNGDKLNNQQLHEFPRFGVDRSIDDLAYDGDDVPIVLKMAVVEQAYALLDGFDVEKEINAIMLNARAMGDVKVHYDRTAVPINLKVGICSAAWIFLSPLLRDFREVRMVRV